MKIVINRCYGGFGLSHEAVMLYAKKKGWELHAYVNSPVSFDKYIKFIPGNVVPIIIFYTIIPLVFNDEGEISKEQENNDSLWFRTECVERNDPLLVEVVEELKGKANGRFAKLEVVEIPDDVKWEISDYDGVEQVKEIYRSWLQ